MPIVNILAVIIPALVGVVAGVAFGHRQVRVLREKTGDDSNVTKVLSGEFLRHRHKEAA